MTYCLGIMTREGLVMASDSRTNAGYDQVNVCRKMHTFVVPGERAFALLTSGSLSLTQSITTLLQRDFDEGKGLATAPSLYDLRNLFQVNVEEARHLWAMVYLLQKYFGRDGREEAEDLLRRRYHLLLDRAEPVLPGAARRASAAGLMRWPLLPASPGWVQRGRVLSRPANGLRKQLLSGVSGMRRREVLFDLRRRRFHGVLRLAALVLSGR